MNDPLDIPAFLVRDANNRAEFMSMSDSDVVDNAPESRPAKSKPKVAKPNGHDKAPAKAAGKPAIKATAKAPAKAKTAPKAAAKPAKAIAKAKATSKREPTEKDQYGFRKGSMKSKAIAMYARKNGATLDEVKAALGSVQLNALTSLEENGAKVERIKEERKGQRSVTRYILKS